MLLAFLLACPAPTCDSGQKFNMDGLCVADTGRPPEGDTDADTDADSGTDTGTDTGLAGPPVDEEGGLLHVLAIASQRAWASLR
ncbi:MAG: hypothetical protein FJ102_27560 [Deltaproteobacteria bacterium]|nr:hypothetical protein [Deltaproteobacteria bacterium]